MEHHRLRKYRGPETWAFVRAAYVAGEPAPAVARRFDVGLSNLRRRALKEGWTRKDVAVQLDLKPVRGASDDPWAAPGTPDQIEAPTPFILLADAVERATRRAAWLVANGRGPEATALLRAVEDLRRVGPYTLPEEQT